jgi:adenosylcobinamide kinase/adenosylcobinamide-phosphate guanylyltransferase
MGPYALWSSSNSVTALTPASRSSFQNSPTHDSASDWVGNSGGTGASAPASTVEPSGASYRHVQVMTWQARPVRIRMLGSGASDGWPNPWCSCASCLAALDQGVVRGQTSALVDGRLLIDLGPDGPRAAARQGVSLRDVELALVTHRHVDHHFPQAWVWRSWADPAGQLSVVAPPLVLHDAAETLAGCLLHPIGPGDSHESHGYVVRALAANHPDDAVLYDITGPDGARLFYGTDTGVLPEATVEALRDRAFDVVLLELAGTPIPSHLTLDTWPDQVARLRAVGAVVDSTQVVAVHVGHHNPPPDELDRALAALGARAARDGEVIDTARGRTVLVLGGQSSGKSAYAESLLHGDVLYVATAPPRDGDPDWDARVKTHADRRPASWTTLETGDVAGVLDRQEGAVLVDDLGLWLTRVLDQHWDAPTARPAFDAALASLLEAWTATRAHVVLVAPEVGSGVVPATASGRLFADLLGRATTALAGTADEVVQVVAGQPRRLR